MDKPFLYSEKALRNLAILDTIRRRGPISRIDISKIVGINPVTVSNYIERYIKERLVLEKSLDASRGGRRPVLLDINPSSSYALGVGINLFGVVGVLIDLEGNIIYKTKIDKSYFIAEEVIDNISQVIEKILEENVGLRDSIKGIGIGIAGIVDKERGMVRWPTRTEKQYKYHTLSFPLKDLIEEKFSIFTMIENDATSACFAEYWLSLPQDTKNALYMFSGVGAGLFLEGNIYTGFSGCAGELSVFNPQGGDLFNCRLGNPCFLKRWERDLGIVEEVKVRLRNNKNSLLKKVRNPDKINLQLIFEYARKGDNLCQRVLKKAGQRLGIKLAFIVNLLNPEVVIIGGGIERGGPWFMETLEVTLKEWAFEEMVRNLKIIPSSLGEDSIALGGASLIVREIFVES